MRLLNLIKNDCKNKQIVISRMLEGYSREDTYEGIHIYRYKHFYEIPLIVKRICKFEKVDVIHCHNLRPAFWGNVANLFMNKPTILEMHSVYEVSGLLKNYLRKKVLNKAKYIIVISEESKRILTKEGIQGNHIQVLYNGIELNKFHKVLRKIAIPTINEFFDANKEKVIVGYIGSLRSFQGIDNVISIINSVKNEKIAFVVIGGEKGETEELRKQIHNSNVLLHEFIPQEEVPFVYFNLDILLMPRPIDKQTNSAVPLKPIEALAAGCRILTTASGGMLELKRITKCDKLQVCSIDEMIGFINYENIKKTNKEFDGRNQLAQFDIEMQREKLARLYELVCERVYK